MANYNISPEAANAIVGEMIAITRKLDSSLTALEQSVAAFTVANAGQAPDAYYVLQHQWDQGHQAMQQSLSGGAMTLEEITANYVRGDNQGAAIFS